MAAPTRFLSDGMRSRPSTWASRMTALDGFVEDERLIEGAAGGVFGKTEGAGGVSLRIAVDDEGALFGCGERGTEVHGGGGLADAAFLVRDRDYAGQIRFSFAWRNVAEGK